MRAFYIGRFQPCHFGHQEVLEQPSDLHVIVCYDVPVSRRAAIRDEVYELRRIIEDMFERFALSPKELSSQRSVAAYALVTANNFYELGTRFQETSRKRPEEEADALTTCCAAITDRLWRIIRMSRSVSMLLLSRLALRERTGSGALHVTAAP